MRAGFDAQRFKRNNERKATRVANSLVLAMKEVGEAERVSGMEIGLGRRVEPMSTCLLLRVACFVAYSTCALLLTNHDSGNLVKLT